MNQSTLSVPDTPPVVLLGGDRKPIRVLMVAANVDSRFGGVSSSLGPLCAAVQTDPRFRVSIAAFTEPDENVGPLQPFAPVTRYPLRGLRALLGSEPAALTQQIEQADLVHIHGLWQEHCASAAAAARRLGKPYLISAHGMLDRWALAQKNYKKLFYLKLVERKNLSEAAGLHALTSAEVADYRRITKASEIETIPNSVETPSSVNPEVFLSTYKKLAGKTIVLFLSRLHQKKGLDLLSEAWRRVAPSFPAAHLVIAGPDFADLQKGLESEFAARNVANSVTFTGMLASGMKWSALAAAHLFVLPSRSEGLSMAALEAMSIARPVLLTEQCHVDHVVEQNCGWQIQPDVGQLEWALREFLQSPESAREMGRNGRKLVASSYSPNVVGSRMREFYRRIVSARALSSR